MALSTQSHPPFAVEIHLPVYVNYCTYVPEPPMKDGRRKSWYHASLIPYTLVDPMNAFKGPLPKFVKKPHMVNHFFPT